MANFADMLKMFCKDTGRHGLVADFAGGDYTDNGAGAFINAGLAYLDKRFFNFLGGDSSYVTTLTAGEYQLSIPSARHINEVWVRPSIPANSSKIRLKKKTPEQLRAFYQKDFSQVSSDSLSCVYARQGNVIQTQDSDA